MRSATLSIFVSFKFHRTEHNVYMTCPAITFNKPTTNTSPNEVERQENRSVEREVLTVEENKNINYS